MGSKSPTDQDRAEAIRQLVSGLARGDDVFHLAAAVEDLHPRDNTFPGEMFMYLSAGALDLAGVTRDDPIPYLELREKYLGECRFRGRDNRKIQFAILAAASARGGIEPDLLDEVVWWQTDDFWWYALAAAVAVIRACADKTDAPGRPSCRNSQRCARSRSPYRLDQSWTMRGPLISVWGSAVNCHKAVSAAVTSSCEATRSVTIAWADASSVDHANVLPSPPVHTGWTRPTSGAGKPAARKPP